MSEWIRACALEDIDSEDVMRFDHDGQTFAVIRAPDDQVYVTDGLCTHERVHLADGLVMGNVIECPKHNGRFDYRSGKGLKAPICVDLKTYKAKVENGDIFFQLT